MRDLLKKGTKYREAMFIEEQPLRNNLIETIDNFIGRMTKKYRLKNAQFKEWKEKVIGVLNNKINLYNHSKPWLFKPKRSILKQQDVAFELENLQKKFVICSN